MLLQASCKKGGDKKAERGTTSPGRSKKPGRMADTVSPASLVSGGEERDGKREVERQSLEGGGREGRRDGEEARTHEGQSDGRGSYCRAHVAAGRAINSRPPEHCRLETSRMFAEPRINLFLLLFEVAVFRLNIRRERCSVQRRNRPPWRAAWKELEVTSFE